MELAEQGKKITHKRAKEIVEQVRIAERLSRAEDQENAWPPPVEPDPVEETVHTVADELLDEVINHCSTLKTLVKSKYSLPDPAEQPECDRRTTRRLLGEIDETINALRSELEP